MVVDTFTRLLDVMNNLRDVDDFRSPAVKSSARLCRASSCTTDEIAFASRRLSVPCAHTAVVAVVVLNTLATYRSWRHDSRLCTPAFTLVHTPNSHLYFARVCTKVPSPFATLPRIQLQSFDGGCAGDGHDSPQSR